MAVRVAAAGLKHARLEEAGIMLEENRLLLGGGRCRQELHKHVHCFDQLRVPRVRLLKALGADPLDSGRQQIKLCLTEAEKTLEKAAKLRDRRIDDVAGNRRRRWQKKRRRESGADDFDSAIDQTKDMAAFRDLVSFLTIFASASIMNQRV